MKGVLISIILMLMWITHNYSQQPDSLYEQGREVIGQQLEHLEFAAEAGIDLSELTGKLEYLLENPININDAEKGDLRKLGLLSDVQVKNIIDYRTKYGIFYSIYELRAIEGIGRNSIEKIMPFVRVKPAEEKIPAERVLLRGRHEMIVRFQRSLVSKSGYMLPPDSLQADKVGSFYLGDANRYYLKYRYKVKGYLSAGITAEKDPGEIFLRLPKNLSDTIREQVKKPYGFDFYSAHLELKNIGPIRTVILGDYHMQCGQGLVLWSGLSFNGGNSPSTFKRYAAVVKASTSANENLFMRGLAARIGWHNIDLSLFYSRNHIDANIKLSDKQDDVFYISSLPENGYHRTLNELADKRTLIQQHWGGHLSYSQERFRIGFTAFRSLMDISLDHDESPAKKFTFSGSENFNAGMNYDFLFRNTSIYGELGFSINGGWAFLSGMSHTSKNGSIISLLFREYRKEYQNLMAGAIGDRDGNANERSLRMAIECPLHRTLSLLLHSEHISYPWLTSRNINVFRGQEHEISMFLMPTRQSRIQLRYRFKNGILKSSDNLNWLDEMRLQQRHQLRLQLQHKVSPDLSIKCQYEQVMVKKVAPETKSKGSLLLVDVNYHPEAFPIKINLRYALFNTDDYDSRLYAYENDVLYASSMPAYYGKGFRTYLLLSYKASRRLQFWLRFSLTNFTDRNVISSGTEEIQGNKHPEVKIQCRIKL